MQFEAQKFLPIAEKAGAICVIDSEATGLKGDYNSLLVVTVKPLGGKPVTLTVDRPGDDKALVCAARDLIAKYSVWITFYGRGFDIPMLQTRLLYHNCKPLEKKHHIDMYYHIRAHTITARRSQAHLLEFLETPQKKMTLAPELWNVVLKNPKVGLKTLRARCESDCAGLENLYNRAKHLIAEISR